MTCVQNLVIVGANQSLNKTLAITFTLAGCESQTVWETQITRPVFCPRTFGLSHIKLCIIHSCLLGSKVIMLGEAFELNADCLNSVVSTTFLHGAITDLVFL